MHNTPIQKRAHGFFDWRRRNIYFGDVCKSAKGGKGYWKRIIFTLSMMWYFGHEIPFGVQGTNFHFLIFGHELRLSTCWKWGSMLYKNVKLDQIWIWIWVWTCVYSTMYLYIFSFIFWISHDVDFCIKIIFTNEGSL